MVRKNYLGRLILIHSFMFTHALNDTDDGNQREKVDVETGAKSIKMTH